MDLRAKFVRNIGYPLRDALSGRSEIKYYNFLEKTQWWSSEKLLKLQQKKLRNIIRHAYQNVPYYNQLFKSIETLLPSKFWSQIVRVAVATGPGGYTGTRITIVFARTIGQQLNCQVDGISSFELMVPRLISSLNDYEIKKSFWITKSLKRHGLIGGKYKIINSNKLDKKLITKELISPCLVSSISNLEKQLFATDNIKEDIVRLLEISLSFYKRKKKSSWQKILPIYPTSPVEAKQ